MRVTALPTRLVKPGDNLFDVLEEAIWKSLKSQSW